MVYFPGDRLISVNSVSLEGVSHHAAVDILQNAPEDVTLVISQPKEKPSKGNACCASPIISASMRPSAQQTGLKLFISPQQPAACPSGCCNSCISATFVSSVT